ncbi:MAG: SURF1 family protein, partial [Planktomarina sp.]
MRFWGMVVFGLAGTAVLISLGLWQIQRLAWKNDVLAQIENTISDAPSDLPVSPNQQDHTYLPVAVTGEYGPITLKVLVSRKFYGAGFRLITEFKIGERHILVDRGFIKQDMPIPEPPSGLVNLTGNLHWPQEVDGFTPNPDWNGRLIFARDIPQIAEWVGTEPSLLVLRTSDPLEAALTPLPVSTSGIPNDHLQYALT